MDVNKSGWQRTRRYNGRSFARMQDIEKLEFAFSVAHDGFPLDIEERKMFVGAILSAIEWGLTRDRDYEARVRYQKLLREEQRRYNEQREASSQQPSNKPDLILNL